MVFLAWISLAFSQECRTDWPPIDDAVSMAWVSPVGARVGLRGVVELVPTADLAASVRDDRSVATLLQSVGLRKRSKEPKRRYKVTIFDVSSSVLCRPVEGEEGQELDGVVGCEKPMTGAKRTTDGCGFTLDRSVGQAALPVYRAQWPDIAINGFCVLPADRYVASVR